MGALFWLIMCIVDNLILETTDASLIKMVQVTSESKFKQIIEELEESRTKKKPLVLSCKNKDKANDPPIRS